MKRHGEAGSMPPDTVDKEKTCIQQLIKKKGYERQDIFNADETSFFYAYIVFQIQLKRSKLKAPDSMPPDQGLADKHHSGVKGKKTRLTYLLTTNADGSRKLAPFIIGKAYKPRAFNNKTGSQLGFNYRNNLKAWMTAALYQEWLLDWDAKLRQEGRKVLLLQDNFSGHIILDTLTNIHVENFAPNLTSHVQPNDQGIISCFKSHYRSRFIQRAMYRYNTGTTPALIYEVDQLKAINLLMKPGVT